MLTLGLAVAGCCNRGEAVGGSLVKYGLSRQASADWHVGYYTQRPYGPHLTRFPGQYI
jgi:hypothetical protein